MRKDKYELLVSTEGDYDDGFRADDFNYIIDTEVAKYEKRYKTRVVGIILAGTVGLWTGNTFGGKLINYGSILSGMANCDYVELYKEKESKEVVMAGYHHDGTHYMKIYLVSESKATKHGINLANTTTGSLEKWIKLIKPLKLR